MDIKKYSMKNGDKIICWAIIASIFLKLIIYSLKSLIIYSNVSAFIIIFIIEFIIDFILCGGLGAIFALEKKYIISHIIFIIGMVSLALGSLKSAISALYYSGSLTGGVLLYFLGYVCLLVTLILYKKKNILKRIWFLGGAFVLLGGALDIIHYIRVGDYVDTFTFTSVTLIFVTIFETIFGAISSCLIGLWIYRNSDNVAVAWQQVKNKKSVISIIGTADQIRNYKNLADNGILTQEEFEAKKREIFERFNV